MAAAGVNINQQGADYIIGKDDMIYYAIKASDGTMAYSGTDAQTVLEAAIAASPDFGSIVLLDEIFEVEDLTLNGVSNLTIRGTGTLKLDAPPSNLSNVLTLWSCDNIRIEGITIDGSAEELTYIGNMETQQNGLVVYNSTNVSIVGVDVTNVRQNGIYITSSSLVSVDGCSVTDGNCGILLYYYWEGETGAPTTKCRITNNRISGMTLYESDPKAAIYLSGYTADTIVAGNFIDDCQNGIRIDTSENLLIENNVLTGGASIYIASPAYTNNIAIRGNLVEGAYEGIYINAGTKLMVNDNIVRAATTNGIRVVYASDIQIVGNQVNNCGGHGVNLSTCTDVLVDSNCIQDNSQTTPQVASGIVINYVDRMRMSNNLIGTVSEANQLYALYATNSDVLAISSNSLYAFNAGVMWLPASVTNVRSNDNVGYKNRGKGVATITGAVNIVVVSHTLFTTPASVVVTCKDAGAGLVTVESFTGSTFTIRFATQPGASTWTFCWMAEF